MLVNDLPTPSLLLDLDRLERNCDRMIRRAAELGVRLRPHMKTAKSADVGRLATRERAVGVAVSTLAEAEHFARDGCPRGGRVGQGHGVVAGGIGAAPAIVE
jgi:D-serine deaminase-like pyridoxal phosphate-dependent protein